MGIAMEEFRRVIETHQSMVYSIALRVTCDRGTAEEVAQDVFLKLYRLPAPPREADHRKYWLRRAATHTAIDALRRQGRQPEAGAEEWTETEHDGRQQDGDTGAWPKLPVGLEVKLEDLLRTLPEGLRVAVALRYGEDLRPEEIAEVLAQPVATVKSNLQRGLRLLRQKAEVTLKEYVRNAG